MDIATLFFVFLAIAVVGIIGAVINMVLAVNNAETAFDNSRGIFIRHGVFALCYVVGGLAALITGIIWIVQQFS